jgi:hypothetical protein
MGPDTVFCGTNNTGVDFARAARAEEKILVIVEWRDIVATAGWEQAPTCPTFFSVGWLVRYDNDTITIAMTKDHEGFMEDQDQPQYYAFHSFPAGVVSRLQQIETGQSPNDS